MIRSASGARIRRVGSNSVLDNGDGGQSLAVSGQVDRLGFGTYQWIVLVSLGIALVSDAVDSGSMEPLNRALDIAFQLPMWARAALPAVHCVGSLVGLALAGPVCDQCGRKSTLVFALALSASSTLALSALPISASPLTLLTLRVLQGFGAGFGMPCLFVLLVESCPTSQRTPIMYGAHAFAASGYLLGALGLQQFMPGLGQDPEDKWRQFCIFVALPPLLSLPLVVTFLKESPYFWAVKNDTARCVKVLKAMARKNKKNSLMKSILVPEPSTAAETPHWALTCRTSLAMVVAEGPLILLLCAIDGGRTFMTSGSVYLWPQLFVEARKRSLFEPSLMNVIASASPFVGLAACASLAWIGTRRMILFVSAIATTALLILTRDAVLDSAWALLIFVVITKTCYGPLHASTSLMKTESFPTEVRATSFAIITVVSGLGRTAAPTIAEILKGDNEKWDRHRVVAFLIVLAACTIGSALMVLLMPAACDSGAPLEDFVAEDAKSCKKTGLSKTRLNVPDSYGATWATPSNSSACPSDCTGGASDSNGEDDTTLEQGSGDAARGSDTDFTIKV